MSRVQELLEKATTLSEDGFVLWNPYAVEAETALLLFYLVRHLKPELVVESGSGEGISGVFIAEALADNGKGKLVTFEWFDHYAERAKENLKGLPAEVRSGLSADSGLSPDLVLVDCVSDERVGEIEYWLTHPDRPFVIVHDANRDYPLHFGEGVHLPGHDGVWIGRGKE